MFGLYVVRVCETSICRFFVALVGVLLFYMSLISVLLRTSCLLLVVSVASSVCGCLLVTTVFC